MSTKVIDANLYWFPEKLFTDESLAEKFLSEIPGEYGIKGSLKTNPNTGLKQYVIEKPAGCENLNYVQGDYVLETQLADLARRFESLLFVEDGALAGGFQPGSRPSASGRPALWPTCRRKTPARGSSRKRCRAPHSAACPRRI